jgi:hypothetical protein
MFSSTAVQTSDLANFPGGYMYKMSWKEIQNFEQGRINEEWCGFTCIFFHHSICGVSQKCLLYKYEHIVRFEVLMAVNMKTAVFGM